MRKFNDKYSLVRVLHAVPEGDEVDVYLGGSPFFRDLDFTDFSPYVYIPEGSYEMSVYPADEVENPIVKETINIGNGQLITIAITGNPKDLKIITIPEDMDGISKDSSKVRAVHLSPNAPEINIVADGEILFKNVKFRDVTDYAEVPPKTYKVDIVTSDTNRLIRSNQVVINGNRIYTFYAMGNVPNVQIIQSLDGATFID